MAVRTVSERGPRWQVPGRDEYVSKQTPRAGVPAFVEEECTGKYEGEELARIRARRPTPERISKVEVRIDDIDSTLVQTVKSLAETRETVARIDGKMDALLDLGAKAEQERQARHAADIAAAESRRKFVIALIGALGTAVAAIVTALVMR
jgi:uncharacterized coiled-coil protein SlyX